MKLLYSYHSEHNADKQDRWIHFLLFVGALMVLLAAVQQLYFYFTAWSSASEESGSLSLFLGVAFLLIAGWLAWSGVRLRSASRGDADRYVRVTKTALIWHLDQRDAQRSIPLSDIVSVTRLNVRELEIKCTDGTVISLPVFLIANTEKQTALITVLESCIRTVTPRH